MNRNEQLQQLRVVPQWDVLIIGGGATGLGLAVDAASRGYQTVLVEKVDFAKGTSSRSTKLVHGGVRYLAQLDIALVREALRERGRLERNAPHLFRREAFIIAGEKWWTAPYYTFGLWLYDRLAGALSIGRTRYLSAAEAKARLTGVKAEKLRAGVCYYDGQFDDARLAINLAQTAREHGATVINYCPVTRLEKDAGQKITGAWIEDHLSGASYLVKARCVINATGVFANEINAMDDANHPENIVPSQGVHLVVERDFLPTDAALMIPKTADGRVLFAVPWQGKLLLGTTDTPVAEPVYEPRPLDAEVDFILRTAGEYLTRPPTRADVRSMFVGLRPLAAPKGSRNTKEVSRSHKVSINPSGLVNIIGGKWTTYRQMAEDTLDAAIAAQLLPAAPCRTVDLPIHGHAPAHDNHHLSAYGADRAAIEKMAAEDLKLAQKIHPEYPFLFAEVAWAVEQEMAQTVEDVLARRIRLLFLDARAAAAVAEEVAEFLAARLQREHSWVVEQCESFRALCAQYHF